MHEAAIAENIVGSLEQELSRQAIEGRIVKVFLQVGKLRAVVAENLKFLFQVMARGSRLEGAALEIEPVSIKGRCQACASEFEIDDMMFFCPRCHSGRIDLLNGNELQITGVEVE
jgi:hydrogenase nickel incorporation protein HypA/HybF